MWLLNFPERQFQGTGNPGITSYDIPLIEMHHYQLFPDHVWEASAKLSVFSTRRISISVIIIVMWACRSELYIMSWVSTWYVEEVAILFGWIKFVWNSVLEVDVVWICWSYFKVVVMIFGEICLLSKWKWYISFFLVLSDFCVYFEIIYWFWIIWNFLLSFPRIVLKISWF